MLKWLILFGGGYLAYRWVRGVFNSLFVVHKDEPEVNRGDSKREPSFDADDVVDVNYREVHRDDPDGDDDETREP